MTAPRMGPRDRVHVHDLIDPTLLAEMVEQRYVNVTERREQAEIIKASPYPGVAFAMLDRKNWQAIIWKLIRPEASRPFRQDES